MNIEQAIKKSEIIIPQGLPVCTLVEGVDASGKSTLLRILMDIIKHSTLIHTSAPPKNVSDKYYTRLLKNIMQLIDTIEQPLFVDRFHIGELTYGSIFRPDSIDKLKRLEMNILDKRLKNNNVTKLIYCYANEDIIRERLHNRGDWHVTTDDISPIMKKYEEFLNKSNLDIFRLDTTDGINEQDIINVLKFIYSL